MTAARSYFGLDRQGMRHLGTQHWNQLAPVLYEHAVRRGEGELAFGGSFSVSTGPFTGRTPRDKYIVEEPGTKDAVWWGPINQPVAPERFDSLHQRMLAYLQGRELFIQDLYAGADPVKRLPMHASANVGPKGDCAIFFGLSGTGKTTLSADSSRTLIGDDEHGWSPRGIFNFEGGCYAKVINLSPTAEPEIYATISRFGTVIENVVLDPATRIADVDDQSLTENTRACYPIDFIPNADPK